MSRKKNISNNPIIIDPKTKEPMISIGKHSTLAEMEQFFEMLYGRIYKDKYGTLFTDDGEYFYTIDTSTEEGRKVMAKTCFLLNKAGYDVNFGGVPRSAINKEE